MTLILDAGALIALERNERPMWTRLKTAQLAGEPPSTHAGVLGQVWRGGPMQARLSQALDGIDVQPLDQPLARQAGELLAASNLSDVTHAVVAILATDGDEIVTSDLDDMRVLVTALGRHVELVAP